jgi:hypothetical protein
MDSRNLKPQIINLNEARYRKALEKILMNGGKIDDLSKTNPEDFGLPDTWVWETKSGITKTKDELIGEVISCHFADPNNPYDLFSHPWLI